MSLLEVNTTASSTDYTIEFLKFDDKQTNPYTNMVGTFVGEVFAIDGKATLTDVDFPVNTGTADRVYYVYACLKPIPVDTTCIPFAYITVTIKANPVATLVAKEATCNGSASQNDGSITISGYEPTATYELSTNGVFAGIGQAIPAGGVLLSGLTRTGSQQTYIVRIYNSAGCTTEKFVTLLNASCLCPPPRCVPIAIQKIKSGRRIQ